MTRAKKSLGQHFLRDKGIAERIAVALGGNVGIAVEVGPGHGMLTQFLTGRFDRLILIEKDRDLAGTLKERYAGDSSVTVVEADFLRVDLQDYTGSGEFAIIGNFPYNISSQIVFRMLDYADQVTEMVGMFQLEMAQRILSRPGSKDYGVIGVLTATAYHGERLFRVSPAVFSPPPKVESAVIRLERKADRTLPCRYSTLRMVVKATFGQRRKMLRNTLKPFLPEAMLQSDTRFIQRPEQLSLEDFIEIATAVESAAVQSPE